jgi:hypothetical protein
MLMERALFFPVRCDLFNSRHNYRVVPCHMRATMDVVDAMEFWNFGYAMYGVRST